MVYIFFSEMFVSVKMEIIFVEMFIYWNERIRWRLFEWILIVMYRGIDKVLINMFVMVRVINKKCECCWSLVFRNILMVIRLFVVVIMVVKVNVIV